MHDDACLTRKAMISPNKNEMPLAAGNEERNATCRRQRFASVHFQISSRATASPVRTVALMPVALYDTPEVPGVLTGLKSQYSVSTNGFM